MDDDAIKTIRRTSTIPRNSNCNRRRPASNSLSLRYDWVLGSARLEAFVTRYAFAILLLTIYVVANLMFFVWGAKEQFDFIDPGYPLWRWLSSVGRGAAWVINLNAALILLLVTKRFLTGLRNIHMLRIIPLDQSFPNAHALVAGVIFFLSVIHIPFALSWVIKYNQFGPFKIWSISTTTVFGLALALVLLVLILTASQPCRKKNYKLFATCHAIGVILFFPLLCLHGVHREKPMTWKWIIGPLLIYAINKLFEKLQTKEYTMNLLQEHFKEWPGSVIELRIPKKFNYCPGQYAQINIPQLGIEWHPFSIASAPHESTLVMYVKTRSEDGWTSALKSIFRERESNSRFEPLLARIRGPFGSPSQHFELFNRVVLVSGGIGATPFASVCKHLNKMNQRAAVDTSVTDSTEHVDAIAATPSWDGNGEKFNQYVEDTVSKLFKLGIPYSRTDVTVKHENARRISNTLVLENARRISSSLVKANTDTLPMRVQISESSRTIGSEFSDKRQVNPRYFPQLDRMTSNILAFLHSTRVIMSILFILIVRFMLASVVAIWVIGPVNFGTIYVEPSLYRLFLVDAALGIIITIIMVLTLSFEINYMRWVFLSQTGRCVDLILIVPLSVLSVTFSILSAGGSTVSGLHIGIHFTVLLPTLFFLLCYRLYRCVDRTLLDHPKNRSRNKSNSTQDVDFLWTTSYSTDDTWLRNDLRPLSEGTTLRLHRFVTRETEIFDMEHHIESHPGRPHWKLFFSSIAQRTRNGSDVGVFFCGPKSMGRSIARVLRDVEVRSNLRGAYLRALTDNSIMQDFGVESEHDLNTLRQYGSNIRFSFRTEKFS